MATGVHVPTLVFHRLPQALQLCAAITAVAFATACGSSTSTEVIAPSGVPARCQTSLSGTSTTFGPTGGSGTLTVGVSRECPWSASSQQPWIEIMSAREGQGEGTVSFRVASNADPVLRRGSITVNDQRLDVSQDPAPCSFNVGATPDTVPAEGAQIPVQVSTHSACQWTAVSESSFATVSPSSGSGPATIQVVVSSNSGSPRTVTVVVAGARRSITQSAATPPPAPPPPAPPTPTPTPTQHRRRRRRRPQHRRRRRHRADTDADSNTNADADPNTTAASGSCAATLRVESVSESAVVHIPRRRGRGGCERCRHVFVDGDELAVMAHHHQGCGGHGER